MVDHPAWWTETSCCCITTCGLVTAVVFVVFLADEAGRIVAVGGCFGNRERGMPLALGIFREGRTSSQRGRVPSILISSTSRRSLSPP